MRFTMRASTWPGPTSTKVSTPWSAMACTLSDQYTGERNCSSNSRLTAVTAACLLVLLAIEGATLLSLRSFLSWHILVGMLLVPVVGLKLATTGYRFMRYYAGDRAFVAAGPPALPLRLLGPVVVCSTLGLFGTGVLQMRTLPVVCGFLLLLVAFAVGQQVGDARTGALAVWIMLLLFMAGLHTTTRSLPSSPPASMSCMSSGPAPCSA